MHKRFLAATVSSLCFILSAQEFSVRLLNGRSGKPVVGVPINLWVGTRCKAAISVGTDGDGRMTFAFVGGPNSLSNTLVTTCGDSAVTHPALPYADTFQINFGMAMCDGRKTTPGFDVDRYKTDLVAGSGVVTANTCGKAHTTQVPGELTVFVRPLTLLEKLKQ